MANTASVFSMGRGSSFSISTDGTTFTRVGQLQQVSYSGGKLDFDDVTNLDSPGNFHEYAPTLNDSGKVQLTGVFSDADPGQLMFGAAFVAATLLTVKMQMAPRTGQTVGYSRTYTAYVSEPLNVSYGTTKALSFQAGMMITGPINEVQGH